MLLYNPDVNTEFEIRRDILIIRELFSLTQDEIAKVLGVEPRTVRRIEGGEPFELNAQSRERFYSFVFRRLEGFQKLKSSMRKETLKKGEVLLFHGSKKGIEGNVSVEKGSDFNDFGKAFYAGEAYEQSAMFVSDCPGSSIYLFSFNAKGLSFKRYGLLHDWLLLVGYHRGMLEKYKDHPLLKKTIEESERYDYLIAPIADNRMFAIIDSFSAGETTDEQCMHCLQASSLGEQYVIKSEKAAGRLKMLERFYLCKEELAKYSSFRKEDWASNQAKVRLSRIEYKGKGKYIDEILC